MPGLSPEERREKRKMEELEAQNKILFEGIRQIIKHQEITGGGMAEYSSVYVIAVDAERKAREVVE